MDVIIRCSCSEIQVTLREKNKQDIFRGQDKTGAWYQFRKDQILKKVEDETRIIV
jgi:hypothetical protein